MLIRYVARPTATRSNCTRATLTRQIIGLQRERARTWSPRKRERIDRKVSDLSSKLSRVTAQAPAVRSNAGV